MEEANENAESKSSEPKKKRRTAKDYAIEFFVRIAVTALAVWLACTFVIGVFVNHSNSSYPMIKDGDLCITYRLAKLAQGDEIAYISGDATKFGRIIAFEGDTVEIKDDYITVNGYGIFEDTVYQTTGEGSSIDYPYTVPDGCVFVLNDFRSDVSDSRTYGGIPLTDSKGKVIFIMRRRGI